MPAAEKKGREFKAYIPEGLKNRIAREIVKEKYVTPYTLSEKYNISVSLARHLLRELERKNIVKLVAKTRRAPVYVPSTSA